MSKYTDELTELICDIVRTVFPNASLDDGYDVADDVIAKLPTIEVSGGDLEDAVLLTKDAYSDLCLRASKSIEVSDKAECDNCIWNVCNYNKIDWEVSEDCISREWLKEHKKVMSYTNEWRETEVGEFVSLENIKDAPSVIPKPKEGEWILECDAEGEGDNLYRCSECGRHCGCQEYDLPNFCYHCGAKMKGAEK